MLDKNQTIAIYMEASLGSEYGKMGYGVMRYISNPIACIIDSVKAGQSVQEACGLPFDYPVVASLEEAQALGAQVLVLGTAPSGGRVPESWFVVLRDALGRGMSLVNGLHDRLSELLASDIVDHDTQFIWDTRTPTFTPPIATARAAALPNMRVLMVGTDMAIGKMTVGLELHRYLLQAKHSSAFVATGQIGITVTGQGIPLDAFKVDHACGAVESAVMGAAGSDIILIEGQGSLLHPGSSATLPLMRGSCANRLILCHRAGMTHLRDEVIAVPPLAEVIQLNESLAQAGGALTSATTVGVALNTAHLDAEQAREAVDELEDELALPVDDVVRYGAGKIANAILSS